MSKWVAKYHCLPLFSLALQNGLYANVRLTHINMQFLLVSCDTWRMPNRQCSKWPFFFIDKLTVYRIENQFKVLVNTDIFWFFLCLFTWWTHSKHAQIPCTANTICQCPFYFLRKINNNTNTGRKCMIVEFLLEYQIAAIIWRVWRKNVRFLMRPTRSERFYGLHHYTNWAAVAAALSSISRSCIWCCAKIPIDRDEQIWHLGKQTEPANKWTQRWTNKRTMEWMNKWRKRA